MVNKMIDKPNESGALTTNIIKKIIVDDPVLYVRCKESCLRSDYYFNRKGCENEKRGHLVIENREVVYNRSAPALEIILSGGSLFINLSGSIAMAI